MTDLLSIFGPALVNYDVGTEIQKSGFQDRAARMAQAQVQQQLAAKAQLDAARQEAIRNPTGANFRRLFVLDPASHESIKAMHSSLDADTQKQDIADLTAVHGYVKAGRKNDAKRVIERRIAADKKAGQDTADDEQFLAMIDDEEDGEDVLGFVSMQLAGALGPDKFSAAFDAFGDDVRDTAKLPSEIAKMDADAALGFAQAGKAKAETGEIPKNAQSERDHRRATQEEWARRYNLDVEKLADDVDLRTRQLDIQEGTVTPQAAQAINTAVTAAQGSRALAARARELGDKFESRDGAVFDKGASGGWLAMMRQGWSKASGGTDPVQSLRREYDQLMIQQAIKNLPPGPASDKDVKMAQRGFPDRNADMATVSSFLRGVSKLQGYAADSEDRKADWLAGNGGNLGPARRGFFVGNTYVKPGDRFSDIDKRAFQQRAQEAAQDRVGQ